MCYDREFYRESECESLANILKTSQKDLTICIDGNWGTGKTTFCRELEKKISETHECVYFDAFASDFQEEPLLAFLAEISKLAPSEAEKEKFISGVAKHCKPLMKVGLRAAIRAGTFGVINTKDFEGTFEDLSAATADGLNSFIGDAIQSYASKESEIQEIRKILHGFVSKQNNQGLVIIVDELDRCRPTYALEVIEKIKHIFNVEGVSFVLSMCKEQLLASINNVYGVSSHSESYLEKFINFTIRLPDNIIRDVDSSAPASAKYCHALMEGVFDYIVASDHVKEDLPILLTHLASKHELSFRDCEKLVDTVTLILIAGVEADKRIREWEPAIMAISAFMSWSAKDVAFNFATKGTMSPQGIKHLHYSNYNGNKDGIDRNINNYELSENDSGLNETNIKYIYSLLPSLFSNIKRGYNKNIGVKALIAKLDSIKEINEDLVVTKEVKKFFMAACGM